MRQSHTIWTALAVGLCLLAVSLASEAAPQKGYRPNKSIANSQSKAHVARSCQLSINPYLPHFSSQYDVSFEWETPVTPAIWQHLDTPTGTVRSLFGFSDGAEPVGFDWRYRRDYTPDISDEEVRHLLSTRPITHGLNPNDLFSMLTPIQKRELLQIYANRKRDAGSTFGVSRRIFGLTAIGRGKIPELTPLVEFMSDNDVDEEFKAVELHLRIAKARAGQSIEKIWSLQATNFNTRSNGHLHVVSLRPDSWIQQNPIWAGAVLVEREARLNIAAEMLLLSSGRALNQRVNDRTGTLHYSLLNTKNMSDLLSHIISVGRYLTVGDPRSVLNKYLPVVALRSGRYDNPKLWGHELRIIRPDMKFELLSMFADAIQHQDQSVDYARSERLVDLIVSKKFIENYSTHELQKEVQLWHYNNLSAVELVAGLSDEELNWRHRANVHLGLNMLTYNWSNNPLVRHALNFEQLQKVSQAQQSALKEIKKIHEAAIKRGFVLSDLNTDHQSFLNQKEAEILWKFCRESGLFQLFYQSITNVDPIPYLADSSR